MHGLGASDMKGALAVMIELALAGAPFDCLFFGREELPRTSQRARAAARARAARRRARRDDGADGNELHAGCLGNINATWTFHGRSGHSARPWDGRQRDRARGGGRRRAGRAPPEPHAFDGLEFREVASVTQIAGGIAGNVIPDRVECRRQLPLRARAARPRRPRRGCAELCAGHGELRIDSNAPSGAVADRQPARRRARRRRRLERAPKQAWTPVAEFGARGPGRRQLRPGRPAQAHRRDESVEVDALVRAYEVLERFAA